jgi:hypothetical protein
MLRMGFFKGLDDEGGDAVLIEGDAPALDELADRLEALEKPGAAPLAVHLLAGMRVYGSVRLTALPVGVRPGIRRVRGSDADHAFEIGQTTEGWLESAVKTRNVGALGPGHNEWQTLRAEDATVVVSSGEYSNDWWDRFGHEGDHHA